MKLLNAAQNGITNAKEKISQLDDHIACLGPQELQENDQKVPQKLEDMRHEEALVQEEVSSWSNERHAWADSFLLPGQSCWRKTAQVSMCPSVYQSDIVGWTLFSKHMLHILARHLHNCSFG